MSRDVHPDAFAQAVSALLTLTPAELRVAARLIERVRLGHASYGALEEKLGRTDWDAEREQEFDDSVVYREIKREEIAMAAERNA